MSSQAPIVKESIHTIEGSDRIRTKAYHLDPPYRSKGKDAPEIILWAGPASLFISADLRGIDLNGLEIRVRGTRLIFHGELCSDLPSVKGRVRQVANVSETFSHVLDLPYEVDVDRAEVQNDNGLISIILKRDESSPHSNRSAQSSVMHSMKHFFGENGDSSNRLKDELTILETLERYLAYNSGNGSTR